MFAFDTSFSVGVKDNSVYNKRTILLNTRQFRLDGNGFLLLVFSKEIDMVPFEREQRRRKFKLLPGGGRREAMVRSVRVVAAPEDMKPFPVDAIVFEEDTFLVLSAEPVLKEPAEHPIKVLNDVWNAQPNKPGTVIVKRTSPLQFLAIVHDLNKEPTWREEWVISSLVGVFRQAEDRRLRSLAIPLLGTKHGSMDVQRCMVLLKAVLTGMKLQHVDRLWLIVPEETRKKVLQVFSDEEK